MGQLLSSPIRDKVTESGSDDRVMYTVTAMHGWRRFMEDAHAVDLTFSEDGLRYFGVFDGHSGGEVSKYLSRHLGQIILNYYQSHGDLIRAIAQGYLEIDQRLGTEEAAQELKELAAEGEGDEDPEVNSKVEMLSQFLKDRARKMQTDPALRRQYAAARREGIPIPRRPGSAGAEERSQLARSLPTTSSVLGQGRYNGRGAMESTDDMAMAASSGRRSEDLSVERSGIPIAPARGDERQGPIPISRKPLAGAQASTYAYSSSPPVSLYQSPVPTPSSMPFMSPPSPGTSLLAPGVEVDGFLAHQTDPTIGLSLSAPDGGVNPFMFGRSPAFRVGMFMPNSSSSKLSRSPNPSPNGIANGQIPRERVYRPRQPKPTNRKRERVGSIAGVLSTGPSLDDSDDSRADGTRKKSISERMGALMAVSSPPRSPECESTDESGDDTRLPRGRAPHDLSSGSIGIGAGGRDRGAMLSQKEPSLLQEALTQHQESAGLDSQEGHRAAATGASRAGSSREPSISRSRGGADSARGRSKKREREGCSAGSTAVVAFITPDNRLVVGNAGDSRCVLCRDGKAIDMSVDHKPELPSEMDRIQKAGANVVNGRVNGSLNLSRALGDLDFKKNPDLPAEMQAITACPDVRTIDLSPEDEFIVLACDGIWEVLESQQVCDYVRRGLGRGDKLSDILETLVDACLSPTQAGHRREGLGLDNMTIVVATLGDKYREPSSPLNSHDDSMEDDGEFRVELSD